MLFNKTASFLKRGSFNKKYSRWLKKVSNILILMN
jgi:hypothetical protein